MMIYLVMDQWNTVVSRFSNQAEAEACARAHNGFIVMNKRRYV